MRLIGPRSGSGALKLVLLIIAGALLGGGGFFALTTLRAAEDGGEQENAEAKPAQQETAATETLSLGEFLVNLRSADGSLRYLQTEISIVVVPPADETDAGKAEDGESEEEASLPSASHRYARDVAISVLSSQSFEKLRDDPDRSKLKALLQQELDTALHSYYVRDVLFTAFVMQ